MNSILPLSATSLRTNSRTLVRYKETYLAAYALVHPAPTCTEESPGAWTVTADPKYGKVIFRTLTGHFGNGDCPGKTFTFAAIYYEWTAHNNKTISDTISDTFNATWQAPGYTLHFMFNIKVPVVRPDHETTAFASWYPGKPTKAQWQQTLIPPADDPTFDFSGELLKEADAAGTHSDTCWFFESRFDPFTKVAGELDNGVPVEAGNHFVDVVGWGYSQVAYYRLPQGTPPHVSAPCKARFPQQMKIKAPPDTSYNKYGEINELGANIGTATVTSIRAGRSETRTWP